MNKRIKNIWVFFFWIMLMLPLIQMNTDWIRVGSLRGGQDPAAYPTFSVKQWFNGEFQSGFDRAFEQRIGFRNWLIRFRNQIEYSLFSKANASGVVVGRDRYLYERDYIRAWQGGDDLGADFWGEKFRRLRMVSDTLAAKGTRIIVVLEPGKASLMPDYIPSRYKPSIEQSANYHRILEKAAASRIPLLDLNRFFIERMGQVSFPLFPKGGIHWSQAGMLLCADTLMGFITSESGRMVPRIRIGETQPESRLEGTDDDLAQIMNLLFQPKPLPMAYPEWTAVAVDTAWRPSMLAISDSYFFNLLNAGLVKQLFSNEQFWYYNKTIYPESWSAEKTTDSIDIQSEVERMDLILIMVTERFWYKFDWDFTDQLFECYYPDEESNYLYDYYRMIVRNFQWFDDIYRDSRDRGLAMTELLNGHAGYQFWVDDQKNPFPRDLSYYRMKIQTDTLWMSQIRDKAILNGIIPEEQIELDARWMMDQDSL